MHAATFLLILLFALLLLRVIVIGNREGLPKDIAALITEAETLTAENQRLRMVVAFKPDRVHPRPRFAAGAAFAIDML